jgi:hypothetical protein
LKAQAGTARAGIVPAESFRQFFLAVNDPHAAFYARF